jgi:hypothetical protein
MHGIVCRAAFQDAHPRRATAVARRSGDVILEHDVGGSQKNPLG